MSATDHERRSRSTLPSTLRMRGADRRARGAHARPDASPRASTPIARARRWRAAPRAGVRLLPFAECSQTAARCCAWCWADSPRRPSTPQAWAEERLASRSASAWRTAATSPRFSRSRKTRCARSTACRRTSADRRRADAARRGPLVRERSAEADSEVVRLVRSTLHDALKTGASDIHLETTAAGLAIKFRIDGVLTAGRS